MKKKCLQTVLTLAIALVMLFTMSAAAFADGDVVFVKNLEPSLAATAGESYTLTVSASVSSSVSGASLSYNWYTSNSGSPVATGSSYTFTASSSFSIWCTVTASLNGTVLSALNSNVCTVTVSAAPTVAPTAAPSLTTPSITKQPSSCTLSAGQTATLSVTAVCPNVGNGLSLSYQWFRSSNSNGSNAQQISGANSSTYTTPAYTNGTVYYFVGVVAVDSSGQYGSAAYSNVVYVTYNGSSTGGALKITKNPTGETVDAGGSATFIARADNAAKLVWRIVSKDTTKTVNAKEAPSYFSGLQVSGTDTETLVLSNIPASMHEWSVECKFIASDGKTYLCTTGAVIRVRGASTSTTTATASPAVTYNPSSAVTTSPSPSVTSSPSSTTSPNTGDTSTLGSPVISSQPVGAVLSDGETTTLSVSVSSTTSADAQIKYQWYRNDTNSNANGTPISGAQSSTYVPDTISGSKYYYVGVWYTDGTTTGKVTYSTPVAVTYTAPLTSPTPTVEDKTESSSLGLSIIGPVIAMVLAAAAIGVGVFFLLKNSGGKNSSGSKKKKQYYDEDDYDDYR
jgi:hypothetical protein